MNLVEGNLHERRDDVGHQHFLRQTNDEYASADRSPAEREPTEVQLASDGLVANDRPRDQLRKEGNIERDVDRIAVGPETPPVDVDDVGEAVEGEERDPKRKVDIGRDNRQSERRDQTGEIGGDEIRVFEDAENEKISCHRDRQRDFARGALPIVDEQGGKEIEGDREQKDDDELRFSPCIEHQGEHQSQEIFAPDRRSDEIEGQKDRKEVEEESYRGKNHYRNAAPSSPRIEWRLRAKTRLKSLRPRERSQRRGPPKARSAKAARARKSAFSVFLQPMSRPRLRLR